MQKALHSIASVDTPASVEIPSSWAGLAMWAVGRFGGNNEANSKTGSAISASPAL